MNTKIIPIACVCVGFISGYALRSFFMPAKGYDKVHDKEHITQRDHWQQKAKQWDSVGQAFRQQQILIRRQLDARKRELAAQKEKQKLAEQRARWLGEKGKLLKDSSAIIANCDSLTTTVTLLVESHRSTDSLYDDLVTALETQSLTKDSMLNKAQRYRRELEVVVSDCFALQQELMDDNERLKKQITKEKRKHKLISAIVFIASGAAIYGLLQ